LQKLEKQSLDFLLRNAGSALKSNGINHLPKDTLLSMLEGDDLNVDEEVVFNALMGWCEANKSGGQSVKDEFAAFLLFVRLSRRGLCYADAFLAFAAQLDEDKCTGAGAKRALEGAEESGRNTKRRRKCWGVMTTAAGAAAAPRQPPDIVGNQH
jgi:hypothetical protein